MHKRPGTYPKSSPTIAAILKTLIVMFEFAVLGVLFTHLFGRVRGGFWHLLAGY